MCSICDVYAVGKGVEALILQTNWRKLKVFQALKFCSIYPSAMLKMAFRRNEVNEVRRNHHPIIQALLAQNFNGHDTQI